MFILSKFNILVNTKKLFMTYVAVIQKPINQLIWIAIQDTGFYIMTALTFNGLSFKGATKL